MADNPSAPIRLLAIIEATTISGPAKLLLEFHRRSRQLDLKPQVIITLATFVRGARRPASNQFLDACAAEGVRVHCIHDRSAFDPGVIGGLRQLSRELVPDIIETHGTKSHFLLRLSKAWRDCPWIAFHHGYAMEAKRTEIYNHLDRWSLRAPSAVVTVCEPFKRQLVQRGAPSSRISVLHNAISPDWLKGGSGDDPLSMAETPTSAPGKRIILAVGRLSKEKAFADLIFAMDQLRRLHPQVPTRLLILGEGPEKPHLERYVRLLRLEDRVQLCGHVRDVRPYFRIAEALAISSIGEGEPMALLEAMAAGIPVAATAVGGIPGILADRQTGLLVVPRSPAAMAAALAELLSDEALSRTLAHSAMEHVKLHHSVEIRARSLVQLYERVLGARLRKLGPPA
jgi:glycosyltransferase involved in cell wall biosynthesis